MKCIVVPAVVPLTVFAHQAEGQQAAASVTAPDEVSVRCSIQAEFDKKMKEEKLGLIKRTLTVGRKAVRCNPSDHIANECAQHQVQPQAAS